MGYSNLSKHKRIDFNKWGKAVTRNTHRPIAVQPQDVSNDRRRALVVANLVEEVKEAEESKEVTIETNLASTALEDFTFHAKSDNAFKVIGVDTARGMINCSNGTTRNFRVIGSVF